MGSVIVTFRVMPESVDVDLEKIKKTLSEEIKPQRMEVIPIAFGLNAIKMVKLVEEKEGEMDKIIQKIKSIKGVKEVEVLELTRSL